MYGTSHYESRQAPFVGGIQLLTSLSYFISFWSIYYWPLFFAIIGSYAGVLAIRVSNTSSVVVRDWFFGETSAAHLQGVLIMLQYVLFVGGLIVVVVAIIVLTFESNTTRQIFNVLAIVSGAINCLVAFFQRAAASHSTMAMVSPTSPHSRGSIYNREQPTQSMTPYPAIRPEYYEREPQPMYAVESPSHRSTVSFYPQPPPRFVQPSFSDDTGDHFDRARSGHMRVGPLSDERDMYQVPESRRVLYPQPQGTDPYEVQPFSSPPVGFRRGPVMQPTSSSSRRVKFSP